MGVVFFPFCVFVCVCYRCGGFAYNLWSQRDWLLTDRYLCTEFTQLI